MSDQPASPSRGRASSLRPAAAAIGAPVLLAAVLGVEVLVAAGRPYLVDVDYTVSATVAPPGHAAGQQPPGDPDGSGRVRAPLRLWVLGDSTAAGVGAVDASSSLPVLVAERVAAALQRPVHVRGLGVSGARTLDVFEHQLDLLPRDGVDAVIIVAGSNDVTHVTAPWTMEDQTHRLLGRAQERTQGPVVLGGIPRFAGVGALPQPLRAVTDRYAGVLRARQRQAARHHPGVTFVDLAALASPRFIGRPEAMSADDFHPSEVGYGFWADALAPGIVAGLAVRRCP